MLLVNLLRMEMVNPHSYDLFHILAIIIVLEFTVLLAIHAKYDSDKKFRTRIFMFWIIMLLFELYKQYLYNYELDIGYQWYTFPYQFCSIPLYLLPLVAFMKNSRARDSIMGFLSFFCLFAGLSVIIYPEQVFTIYVGINIQTMLHHGIQVITGVYIAIYNRRKLSFNYFFNSLITLGIILLVAVGLNELFYHAFNVPGEHLNLFYISPYGTTGLPILSNIQTMLSDSLGLIGKYLFILVYGLGLSLCGFIVFLLEKLLLKRK